MAQNADVLIVASMLSLGLELVLPLTPWFRATRVPSIIVGIIFHITIGFFMNIDEFSSAMIGSYLLFLEPDTLPKLFRRLLNPKKSARAEATVNVDTP